jgi:hypothetical protein
MPNTHSGALGQRSNGTIAESLAGHKKADRVVAGIGKEIERVGLQGRGSGRVADAPRGPVAIDDMRTSSFFRPS